MPTLVSELDLPELSEEGSFAQRHARRMELKDDHWLVRNMFGYAVLRYEDVAGSSATSAGTAPPARSPS